MCRVIVHAYGFIRPVKFRTWKVIEDAGIAYIGYTIPVEAINRMEFTHLGSPIDLPEGYWGGIADNRILFAAAD